MKFEKLSENKIRITLNIQDLKEKDIDFQSFMANSIESQDLFLDILEEAKQKIGFVTENYQIRIEALATPDNNFIFTITRANPLSAPEKPKKQVHIKRKTTNLEASQAAYLFSSFDDFCAFCCFLENTGFADTSKIAKKISLYEYRQNYYLLFSNINLSFPGLKRFYSSITEFATIVSNSCLFERKLLEHGKLIMKHNAIKTCCHHFIS